MLNDGDKVIIHILWAKRTFISWITYTEKLSRAYDRFHSLILQNSKYKVEILYYNHQYYHDHDHIILITMLMLMIVYSYGDYFLGLVSCNGITELFHILILLRFSKCTAVT